MSMLLLITLMIITALLIVPLCQRLVIPSMLGFMLTGVILGPNLLNLPLAQPMLSQLSNIGLAAVLFLLGLELNPQRLWKIRNQLFAHAGLQILLCAIVAALLYYYLAHANVWITAVMGLSLALSASALRPHLAQLTQTRHGIATMQANNVLQLHLLFAMGLLALLPLLTVIDSAQLGVTYLMALIACSTGLFLSNHVLLPRLMVCFKQPQLGASAALGLLFLLGMQLIFDAFGLSASLAALFAGVLLANSVLAEAIKASVKPFKPLLWGLFFICIGLSTLLQPVLEQFWLICIASLGLLLLKSLSMLGMSLLLRYSWQQSLVMGLLLAQGGELSLILIYAAQQQQILHAVDANLLYWIIFLSTLISPLLLLPLKKLVANHNLGAHSTAPSPSADAPASEVLIIGFGRFGQIVARIAHLQQLRFSLIDNNLNADFVVDYGARLHYADASDANALHAAGIAQCKLVVLAIDDVEDAMNIARHIRLYYPDLTILARARDRHHALLLAQLGITHIWRETYLSALQMAEQLLQLCGVPAAQAAQQIEKFNHYEQQLLTQQHGVFADQHGLESELALCAELRNLFENDAHALKQQPDYSELKHNPGVVKNAADDDLYT